MQVHQLIVSLFFMFIIALPVFPQELFKIDQYAIFELNLIGPMYSDRNNPNANLDFFTLWQIENDSNL